jgi:hypothetical protein
VMADDCGRDQRLAMADNCGRESRDSCVTKGTKVERRITPGPKKKRGCPSGEAMARRWRGDGEAMERRWRGDGETMERRWRGDADGEAMVERRWRGDGGDDGEGAMKRRWRGDEEAMERRWWRGDGEAMEAMERLSDVPPSRRCRNSKVVVSAVTVVVDQIASSDGAARIDQTIEQRLIVAATFQIRSNFPNAEFGHV